MPAPITAEEPDTGPAALAMAVAALGDGDAGELVERIGPADEAPALASWALTYGYHVRLHTPDPADVEDELGQAGLVLEDPARPGDVRRALAARHPVIVSSPGDGPPFLLVLRFDGDELVVADPSAGEHPVRWSTDRLEELLAASPEPCVLELAPRNRADR